MAAAHSFLSPQQFEQLYSEGAKPHFEYWFGEAIKKPMPTVLHGVIQTVIAMLLLKRGWFAATEVRLKISKVAYPVPDVVADCKPLQGVYPMEPVELCVEILSAGDRLRTVLAKAAHYLDWGIRNVWIVDPLRGHAYQMSVETPHPVFVSMSSCLTAGTGEAEICILLADVFGEADRQLGRNETR